MIVSGVSYRTASRRPSGAAPSRGSLHEGGVQIEVVRHDRRAEDAQRDEERVRPALRAEKAMRHGAPVRLGEAKMSSAKQTAMVATSMMTIASILRNPKRISPRSISTSAR